MNDEKKNKSKNVKEELKILRSYMNRLEAEPIIKNIFKHIIKNLANFFI